MLGDDQLETWDILLGELQQQFKQPAHSIEICVSLGVLHRATGVLIDLFGWKVDLGRLVYQQEAWDRAMVLHREQV